MSGGGGVLRKDLQPVPHIFPPVCLQSKYIYCLQHVIPGRPDPKLRDLGLSQPTTVPRPLDCTLISPPHLHSAMAPPSTGCWAPSSTSSTRSTLMTVPPPIPPTPSSSSWMTQLMSDLSEEMRQGWSPKTGLTGFWVRTSEKVSGTTTAGVAADLQPFRGSSIMSRRSLFAHCPPLEEAGESRVLQAAAVQQG